MVAAAQQKPLTAEDILSAIERLDPVELDKVARHVKRLRTITPASGQSQREAELLRIIRRRRPAELGARYRELLHKLHAEALTSEERQELLPLLDLSEAYAARRLEAITELAQLRKTPLPLLMQELGVRPRRV